VEVKPVIHQVEKLVAGRLDSLGIELVDIEYRNENRGKVLRIFVDADSGVDLQLCSKVTHLIKDVIDDNDISYDHLEVSSPGLDRVLKKDKDFDRFSGQKVKIKTSKSFDGPHTIVGILKGYEDGYIKVETENEEMAVPRAMATIVRLHPDL